MQDWQEQYLRNVREIANIRKLFSDEKTDFAAWYAQDLETESRLSFLKADCTRVISEHLFPLLDMLHSASPSEIAELDAFGDQLMDWKTNLDCGTYVAIHEAMLNLYRVKRDRDGIIRELYKLGMGLHYLDRPLNGVKCHESESIHFRNEMVFTEAASYFRYFEQIENEETRGYIIRAMANISLCSNSFKRRINAIMKTIRTAKSPEYRAMAPGLPWDVYLRRSHQQLSSLRERLSEPDITQAEVAAVMDSCYEVFKPETGSSKPSVRWLWPYYEMEYQCGYVSLELTVERMEKLIREAHPGEYDINGVYGTVQMPIFLGDWIRTHEQLQKDPKHMRFLQYAYRKMMDVLMSIPADTVDDYFNYVLAAVVTDYYEVENGLTYRDVTTRLMQRFAGRLYLQSLKAGDLLRCLCAHIWERDPDYFSHLPILSGIMDAAERREILLDYAADCGLYYDFGLLKMNIERITQTRPLFENEDAMYRLHTISGYDDLRRRKSTEMFADIALGHHSAYTGGSDDPSGYVRMESPWRQMTDLVAVVSDLLEHEKEDIRQWSKKVRTSGKTRFSPQALAYLGDESLLSAWESVLSDDEQRCRKGFEYYYS